jgi:undecaprenyl-phosphate galactose phosphotransferase
VSKAFKEEFTTASEPYSIYPDRAMRTPKKKLLFPYKLVLFLSDITCAIAGFGIGLWITGYYDLLLMDLRSIIIFFIFSLIVICFFQPRYLYSYHLLFLIKKHLQNLFYSFIWSIIVLGIVIIAFAYSDFLAEYFFAFTVILVIATIAFIIINRLFGVSQFDLLMPLGVACVVLGIIGMIFDEEAPFYVGNPKLVFLCFFLSAGIVTINRIILVHLVFNKWLRRRFRRQVAIVGYDREAALITRHIINYNAPFWIAGTVRTAKETSPKFGFEKKCLGGLLSLPDILRQNKIDEIIVTDNTLDKKTLIALLDYCTSFGINVWFSRKLMPIIDIKLYIDNFCGLPMVRLGVRKKYSIFRKLKLAFDALISIALLFLLSPIFFLIAAAIKIDSKGPIFYIANSVGKNARNFKMYKFRSMKIDQDSEIHKKFVTQLIEGKIGNEGDKGQPLKITEDPRITKVGKIIRKFSLDELPQMINVIKGQMSLVGPRPCLPYEFEIYPDWYKKRVQVRPGITGLWQVTGRSEVAFEDMILLDLYYIYNRTFILDLQILFETVFVVLRKEGAY